MKNFDKSDKPFNKKEDLFEPKKKKRKKSKNFSEFDNVKNSLPSKYHKLFK